MAADLVKRDRPMPTKLSEWLRVAVEDTRRIPAECSTPELKFVADMSTYVRAPRDGKCTACFAGMAMFGTGVWTPGDDLDDLSRLLKEGEALNALRAGDVRHAFIEYMDCADIVFSPRVQRCAERVHAEAREAYVAAESEDGLLPYEPDMDELVGGPTADCRASDEAYLELADALAEMGL
jgi:hypothetical protein